MAVRRLRQQALAPARRHAGQGRHGTALVGGDVCLIQRVQHPRQLAVWPWPRQQLQHIARLQPARLQHPKIPAHPAAILHPPRHVRPGKAHIQLPAGLPPLAELHPARPQRKHIAQADVLFQQAQPRQVFAKIAHRQAQAGVFRRQAAVVLGREIMQGLVHAAVHPAVGLLITAQAERIQPQWPVHGVFIDGAQSPIRAEWARLADARGGNRQRRRPIHCAHCCAHHAARHCSACWRRRSPCMPASRRSAARSMPWCASSLAWPISQASSRALSTSG